MATLSPHTKETLKATLETACANPSKDIPGATVVIVGKDGKDLFAHAAGTRGVDSDEPMTLDNVYWIASCTKMIVGVACMQLVEKGVLKLDDVEEVERLCPELKVVKVLTEGGELVERERGITLRMLLSHTAGFGYTFFNEKLRDYCKPKGMDEFSGRFEDMLQPLVNQPGSRWEYGINIDWAGIVLERATGLSLSDFITKNIFAPLGLKNVSFFPTKSMREKLAGTNQRTGDGTLFSQEPLNSRPLQAQSEEDIKACFNSGGAGCFAKPQEYCQILAMLLNDGTSPTTGAQILKKATVDEMFRNQIPEFPQFGRQGIPAARPHLTNPLPDLYPAPDQAPQGWGLTFMISSGITGRPKASVNWAGLPNLFWWCDRENGVAGMVCSQILPFGDLNVIGLWLNVETAVYKALAS